MHPMRVLFCGQVPKDLAYQDANEDAIEFIGESGRLALSDGASESFDSRSWARLLVEKFVRDPALSQDWLSAAISGYMSRFDVASLSWSKQSAFERGSFATLLCLESDPTHNAVDVLCVGDSLAVLLEDDELRGSIPYTKSNQFMQRPELFSTNTAQNAFFFSADFFSRHHKTWQMKAMKSPIVLCMTDALGEWALRHDAQGSPKWKTLASIRELSQLETLVCNAREIKDMRIDDVTLAVVEFGGVSDGLPQS